MKVGFLDTLAMVALGVGQTEEALLQERAMSHVSGACQTWRGGGNALFLVPERESNVLKAMSIGNSGNTTLAPAKGSRPGGVMAEI